jgi:short-subunit dehydrogenase
MKIEGVVTGASGFLGSAIVRRLAESGIGVLITGRNEEKMNNLAMCIEKEFLYRPPIVVADFANPQFIQSFNQEVLANYGEINFLINCAAAQAPIGRTLDTDMAEWAQSVQVNLLAPVALSRYFGRKFAKRNGGKIINISGGGATGPRPNFSAYAVAKTGLVRFTEILAAELKSDKVQVNAIAPGVMPSAMMTEIVELGTSQVDQVEFREAQKVLDSESTSIIRVLDLCEFLLFGDGREITGKLVSAQWDNWQEWPNHLQYLQNSDLYTLRRIVGRDRGQTWGDSQ